MKNRYILLLFLLFLGISDAMAQRVQEVETSGVVYDKSTGETLPGVNIICRDAKTKKRIPGNYIRFGGSF